MALITANGKGVISATICMPRLGAATADLIVDAQDAITGACLLVIESGLQLSGFATRTGVWQDTAYLRWTAGAGGLSKLATPKHYRSTSARIVFLDLMRAGGETLSPTSDAKTTGLSLAAWTQIAQPIGNALSALLGDARLTANAWRVLPDGTVWAGAETWPDAGLKNVVDYQELGRLPNEGRSELGFEAPALLPGTSLGGRRVSYVEHTLREDVVRTAAWFED
jgi:hypothetical protein